MKMLKRMISSKNIQSLKWRLLGLLLLALGSSFVSNAQQAVTGDIIINELMADPTPIIGLPEREFVELFNRSSKTINLQNWTFKDGSTSKGTIGNVSIAPGEYVIICRAVDDSIFKNFGKTAPVTTFPSPNNDADSIIIADASGVVIDKIYYTADWYRDAARKDGGYTIERINPENDCAGDLNWRASLNINGGTPGTQNSVFSNDDDVTAPQLSAYNLVGTRLLQLQFNENMDTLLFKNTSAYVFNPALAIDTIVVVNAAWVNVFLENDIVSGLFYQLTIRGLADCPGNNIADTTISFGLSEAPGFSDLIITEIMADPEPVVGLPNAEYVEIYNASSKIISLSGVRLSDGSGSASLPNSFLLPGEYRVLTSTSNAALFTGLNNVSGISSFPSLTNSGEPLFLTNSFNETVFRVDYSDQWYGNTLKKDGGWALEMIDLLQPCLETGNWTASVHPSGGTPGKQNSVSASVKDETAPKALFVEVKNADTLQVYLSEKVTPASLPTTNWTFSPALSVNTAKFLPNSLQVIEIALSSSLQKNVMYTLNISNLKDCAGNAVKSNDTLKFGLPDSILAGDIIINEVLFNPYSNGVDFVEILNVSNKILAIKDLILSEEDPVTGDYTESAKLESNPRQILPGQYMVITSSAAATTTFYKTPGPEVFIESSATPNYPDDEGIVVLLRKDLQVLDRFHYLDDYHFKLLDSEDGVSLERISATQPTQNPANWQSAAQRAGFATPGFRNSVEVMPNISGKLNLSPEVFSPDQDGVDDLLGINYSFEKPSYVGNVSVYTAEGILTRRIVKSETLEQQGIIIWDGLDDEGKKARIGIYVVVFEVFDLEGNKDILRAKCVLAGRLK